MHINVNSKSSCLIDVTSEVLLLSSYIKKYPVYINRIETSFRKSYLKLFRLINTAFLELQFKILGLFNEHLKNSVSKSSVYGRY